MEKLNIATGRKLKYCFDLAVVDIFDDPKIFETTKDFYRSHISTIIYIWTKGTRSKKAFNKIVQDNPSNSPREFIVAWKKSITKDFLMDFLMEGSTVPDIKVFKKNKKQLDLLMDRLLKKISTFTVEESNEIQKSKSLKRLVGKGLHDKIITLMEKGSLLDPEIIKKQVDKTSYSKTTKEFIFEHCVYTIKRTLDLLANTCASLENSDSYVYNNYQPLSVALNKAFKESVKKMDLSKKDTWRDDRCYLKDIFTNLTEVIKDFIYRALEKTIEDVLRFSLFRYDINYDNIRDEIKEDIKQISKETLTILKNSVINPKEFESNTNHYNQPFFIERGFVKNRKKENQISK